MKAEKFIDELIELEKDYLYGNEDDEIYDNHRERLQELVEAKEELFNQPQTVD